MQNEMENQQSVIRRLREENREIDNQNREISAKNNEIEKLQSELEMLKTQQQSNFIQATAENNNVSFVCFFFF